MGKIRKLAARFGGIAGLARALGHKNASTVQGWVERNRVPTWHVQDIMDAAAARGIKVELLEVVTFRDILDE